ncbi:MAG: aminotransferase class IV [Cyanobacteriota bacterium]|jgi:4-amino-4-deoxychorismate lyase
MHWFDGQWREGQNLTLDLEDPGFLYGATIFTTLRCYEQSLHHPLSHWCQHRRRLERSLDAFGWPEPDWNRLESVIETLARHDPVLRVTLFADGKELVTGRPLPPDLAWRQREGVIAWVADSPRFARPLAEQKTGNYLPAWLARRQAQQNGAGEAILVNAQDDWLETGTGNLWGWGDDQYWIPPLTGESLSGAVQERLLAWLAAQGREVRQEPWTLDLRSCLQGVAYSNSVIELIPLKTILWGDRCLSFGDFSPWTQLRAYFDGQRGLLQ